MKKIFSFFITLTLIVVAALLTSTNTISIADRQLMANAEALADDPNNPSICDDGEGFSPFCLKRDGGGSDAVGSFCTDGVCKRLVYGPVGGTLTTHLCP